MTDARALSGTPAPCGSRAEISNEISKLGHGGPREHSGGSRPGAGRPRKSVELLLATDPRWCVYQTHPQAERLAANELTRAGYRSYCPLIAAQRRDPVIRSMTRRILVPRFPGYGFVELSAGDRWVPINYTAGIARLLLNDGRPATIPAGEIERHMADDEELCDLTPETMPPLEPGTTISIEDGAFAGRCGIVTRCDGVMTEVETEMFGRVVTARLARRSATPAPERSTA